MSGDETDTASGKAKHIRRAKHLWLNPQITDLWIALDSYQHAVDDEMLIRIKQRRGNPGLPRADGGRLISDLPVPKFLPSNWYDGEWWKSLNEGAQFEVAPDDTISIPFLEVCTVSFCLRTAH